MSCVVLSSITFKLYNTFSCVNSVMYLDRIPYHFLYLKDLEPFNFPVAHSNLAKLGYIHVYCIYIYDCIWVWVCVGVYLVCERERNRHIRLMTTLICAIGLRDILRV